MKELLLLKYVGFASFAILIWDHIDTFPDEVRLLKFYFHEHAVYDMEF